MDALAEKLDEKLRQWTPETAAEVRERVAEVIELADHDVLDLIRTRSIEQEVLDILANVAAEAVPSGSFPRAPATCILGWRCTMSAHAGLRDARSNAEGVLCHLLV